MKRERERERERERRRKRKRQRKRTRQREGERKKKDKEKERERERYVRERERGSPKPWFTPQTDRPAFMSSPTIPPICIHAEPSASDGKAASCRGLLQSHTRCAGKGAEELPQCFGGSTGCVPMGEIPCRRWKPGAASCESFSAPLGHVTRHQNTCPFTSLGLRIEKISNSSFHEWAILKCQGTSKSRPHWPHSRSSARSSRAAG